MSPYAGLDVSDKTTHVCMVDAEGKVLRRDVVANDPEVLAKWLSRHCLGIFEPRKPACGWADAARSIM